MVIGMALQVQEGEVRTRLISYLLCTLVDTLMANTNVGHEWEFPRVFPHAVHTSTFSVVQDLISRTTIKPRLQLLYLIVREYWLIVMFQNNITSQTSTEILALCSTTGVFVLEDLVAVFRMIDEAKKCSKVVSIKNCVAVWIVVVLDDVVGESVVRDHLLDGGAGVWLQALLGHGVEGAAELKWIKTRFLLPSC